MGTLAGGVLLILLLFVLRFVLIIVLLFLFIAAVKELVELLLEIKGFWPFSGVVRLLYKDMFVLPSSFHYRSSVGATFTHAGPRDGAHRRGQRGVEDH